LRIIERIDRFENGKNIDNKLYLTDADVKKNQDFRSMKPFSIFIL